MKSYVRPDKIFTADPEIIKGKAGELKPSKRKLILKKVREIFSEK